jgi:hypothetical protein
MPYLSSMTTSPLLGKNCPRKKKMKKKMKKKAVPVFNDDEFLVETLLRLY